MSRNRILIFSVAAASCIALVGCSYVRQVVRVGSATAAFTDASGAGRGSAVLWQGPDGVVHVEVQLVGLTPGPHGIHFHSVGQCDGSSPTAFTSAGSHFNPFTRKHGLSSVDGPHAGDLPNFTVRDDGTARTTFTTDRVSLVEGQTGVFDADGTALVIHAAADDQLTDPAGNSGARVACGVVRRT